MRRPISRAATLAVLASLVALLLAACGSSDDSSTSTAAAGTGTAAAASDAPATEGGTVGFSIPQGSNPSLQLLDGGIKAEAKKAGLEVQTTDANLDLNKQLSDIDTFIQQKVKAIIVWPMDSKGIQPALERAKEANIPVVAIYTLAGGPYYTDLIIDGVGVGKSAAKYLADSLGEGAKVAAIQGPPQVDQFREMAEGFTAGAKENGLDLVESQVNAKLSPEGAATLTEDYKQRYGAELKGLFNALEDGAIASTAVLEGDFKPELVSYGGTDAGLEGLKSGQLSALVYQNSVLIGRIAGWAAGQAVAGATIPTTLYLEPPVITQDTVADFPNVAEQLTKEYAFEPVERDGKSYMPLFGQE